MIYPEDFEETIGFSTIREMWKMAAQLEKTKLAISELAPFFEFEKIQREFRLMDEWNLLLENLHSLCQWSSITQLDNEYEKANIEHYYFDELEILKLGKLANYHTKLVQYVKNKTAFYPLLSEEITSLSELEILTEIQKAIVDETGELLPYASATYGKISTDIKRLEQEARKVTRSIYKNLKDLGYTAETDVTIREERLVMPIQAEFKRKVNGFVKDVSATGKILYIEPIESLEINNILIELHAQKKREREKILKIATARIRPLIPIIRQAIHHMVNLDLISSRVILSKKIKGNKVQITKERNLAIMGALNPNLLIKYKGNENQVVPISYTLSEGKKMLVISGPNAGGKSIALKTTFLMAYMTHFSLHIPANPETQIPLFEGFAIDMGDAQSSEDDLSTYSAHLKKLKYITENANGKWLMGIDEMGSGTDPRFGGPIALALMEQWINSPSFFIITTHFSSLKEWTQSQAQAKNASMAFDRAHLLPTFKLSEGKPGSSFAIELVQKTGFDQELVQRIHEMIGEGSGKTDWLLAELEQKEREVQLHLESLKKQEFQLNELIEEYRKLKDNLNNKKSEILKQSKEKASKLLEETNRQIEQTIKLIKESKAEKSVTIEARFKLKEFEKEKINKEQFIKEEPVVHLKELKTKEIQWLPGSTVKVISTGVIGELMEIKKDKAMVLFGLVKTWMKLDELLKVEKQETKLKESKIKSSMDWVQRQAHFSPVLDLRGKLGDEAVTLLNEFLENAYMLGNNSLKVIHGRGEGILRKLVAAELKRKPIVKDWKYEHADRGGDGATVIELI